MCIRSGLLAALLAVAVSAFTSAAAAGAFAEGPCPDGAPPERVTCGTLTVPENRADPNTRMLSLAVAIVHARAPEPDATPVVVLHGGPGGAAVAGFGGWLGRPIADKRDVILLDQRGTGRSAPRFCDAAPGRLWRVIAGGFLPDVEQQARLAAELECRTEMREAGIEPAWYTTEETVEDVEALRRALGHASWNVYGISYGTTVALRLMEAHPGPIRSVILDSVYPPDVPGSAAIIGNYGRALDHLFAACAADAACTERFGDLRARYYGVLDMLRERPVAIRLDGQAEDEPEWFILNDQDFALFVHQVLYDNRTIPIVPYFIEIVEQRRADVMALTTAAFKDRAAGISFGMRNSVECADRSALLTPEELARRSTGYPGLDGRMPFFTVDLKLCPAWLGEVPVRKPYSFPVAPIPTLVLAGAFDPITPPAYSARTASGLAQARYAEFSDVGHGAVRSNGCAAAMAATFYDDPSAPLADECASQVAPMSFKVGLWVTAGAGRLADRVFVKVRLLDLGLLGGGLLLLAGGLIWAGAARLRGNRPDEGTKLAGRAFMFGGVGVFAVTAGLLAAIVAIGVSAPATLAVGLPGIWRYLIGLLVLAAFIVVIGAFWLAVRRALRVRAALIAIGALMIVAELGLVRFLL